MSSLKRFLRASHLVSFSSTLIVRDVVFNSWWMIVDIKSSKTVKNGKVHQIPVAQGENNALFPVYFFEEIHKLFHGSNGEMFLIQIIILN